jgi:hypothetical protein
MLWHQQVERSPRGWKDQGLLVDVRFVKQVLRCHCQAAQRLHGWQSCRCMCSMQIDTPATMTGDDMGPCCVICSLLKKMARWHAGPCDGKTDVVTPVACSEEI